MHNDTASMEYDRQLFERFCGRDVRAGIEMENAYGKRLFHYIRRSCIYNDIESAQDCLQSTWLKLIRYCGKPLPDSGLWAMLCTMAKSQALDDHRKLVRQKRDPGTLMLRLDQYDEGSRPQEPVDDGPNPEEWLLLLEEALADEAQRAVFKRAFAALPEKQRQALELQIGQGLSIKAIAERMQEKHETVRSHLRYAKDKLKRDLSATDHNSKDSHKLMEIDCHAA